VRVVAVGCIRELGAPARAGEGLEFVTPEVPGSRWAQGRARVRGTVRTLETAPRSELSRFGSEDFPQDFLEAAGSVRH